MRWILLVLALTSYGFERVTYPLSNAPIDVVIPCIAKDLDTLELCIQGIRKYGQNIRRLIVISPERLTPSAEWYNETAFPFSKQDILQEIGVAVPLGRLGWIAQQLFKLYAPLVIPDLSPNVLVLDADTIFLNPVTFMDAQGNPFFDVASEYHEGYFQHAERLLPGLCRAFPSHSAIVNHMLLQKPVLEDLFHQIEAQHHTELWRAICRCIAPEQIQQACVSEYEIYFNFIFLRTNQAQLRPLQSVGLLHLHQLSYYQGRGYSYAFSHEWARKKFGGTTRWQGTL